jgi:hypothetical protein
MFKADKAGFEGTERKMRMIQFIAFLPVGQLKNARKKPVPGFNSFFNYGLVKHHN